MKPTFLLRSTALVALIALQLACSSAPTPVERTRKSEQTVKAPTAQEHFLQGNAFLDQQQWAEAIDAYTKAVALEPKRWDIHMNRAIAHSANIEFELALASIEAALDNGGQNEREVYFNLGNIYQNRGLYGQAIDAYRAGMAIDGKLDVDSMLNIGAAYAILNELDLARQTLEKVQQLAPDDPRAPHGLALVLQLEEKYDEALLAYERVEAMAPNFSLSYFNRGYVLTQLRRYREAIAAYERYIALDPEGPYVKRARRSIETAQKALESRS
ncbi:MAG: tetratricopeptide repeat protein [Bradymonadaceae bacterium]|nr:tetratricopeptide repeat protein [Lujinxingiaceae bacterium]